MDKKRLLGSAVAIILLGMFSFLLVSDEKSITGNVVSEDTETEEEISGPNLMDTYSIDEENCGSFESGRIRQAFSIIANQTDNAVKFSEYDSNGEIEINCSREIPKYLQYVSGGALAESTENSISFYGIDSVQNNRFPGGCSTYPNMEIREILHVLGFDYSTHRLSIMYGIAPGCLIKDIDEEIVGKLKETYTK